MLKKEKKIEIFFLATLYSHKHIFFDLLFFFLNPQFIFSWFG